VTRDDLLRRHQSSPIHAASLAADFHEASLGPLPDPIAKLSSVQASVQQRAVEAAVRGSKEFSARRC
jgi:hypothetical protein